MVVTGARKWNPGDLPPLKPEWQGAIPETNRHTNRHFFFLRPYARG